MNFVGLLVVCLLSVWTLPQGHFSVEVVAGSEGPAESQVWDAVADTRQQLSG